MHSVLAGFVGAAAAGAWGAFFFARRRRSGAAVGTLIDFGHIVRQDDLILFPCGETAVIDPEALVKAGLIKNARRHLVKVLGEGELGHALTVRVHAVSDAAKNKIESRGGTVEMLPTRASAS